MKDGFEWSLEKNPSGKGEAIEVWRISKKLLGRRGGRWLPIRKPGAFASDIFRKIADVSGLVMTKLDGTAEGGVLVALADRFGLPIHAISVGEAIDDLAPFDPDEFAAALTGAR